MDEIVVNSPASDVDEGVDKDERRRVVYLGYISLDELHLVLKDPSLIRIYMYSELVFNVFYINIEVKTVKGMTKDRKKVDYNASFNLLTYPP